MSATFRSIDASSLIQHVPTLEARIEHFAGKKLRSDNWLQQVFPRVVPADGTILDVGCGAGLMAEYLGEDATDRYCGMDEIDGAIVAARARFPEAHFVYGFFPDDIGEESFDYVIALRISCDMCEAIALLNQMADHAHKQAIIVRNDCRELPERSDLYSAQHVRDDLVIMRMDGKA